MILAWCLPELACAQTIQAPSAHWGALIFPNTKPMQTWGLNFAAFTEFGKAIGPDGEPAELGLPNRYNFQRETLGFNVLSAANTRPVRRNKAFSSNLLYTSTYTLGVVNDGFTEILQNDLIHGKLLRIPPIARGEALNCRTDALRCWIAGYAGELNYHLYSFDQSKGGLLFSETPLFVGAGASVSSIQNDVYGHMGFRNGALWHNPKFYMTVSGIARVGLVMPSLVFQHLAGYYTTAQASLAMVLAEYWFPIVLEGAITGSSGVFIETKRKNEFEPPSPSLRESFLAFSVRFGGFRFETFNDLYAGKDKGPTFGAAIYYSIAQDHRLTRWTSWLP